MKIISLTEIKVIKVIELEFGFTAIKFIKDKGLFLVGGFRTLVKGGSSTIKVFRNDNFEIIKTINDVHKDAIKGFHILQNGLIGSFSFDYVINIWSLKFV